LDERGTEEKGLGLDVRVILVGRTGLDARLRLDPAVEMIRVKSPMEAIGELSDPIDERSPKSAVVIVGADAALDPSGNGSGRDGSDEFVRGLRLVDPHVRVLRTGSATRADGAERNGVAPFDGVVDPDLSSEALRNLIHGNGAEGPGGVPAVGVPGLISGPGLEVTPPLGAEPKPGTRPVHVEYGSPEPPGEVAEPGHAVVQDELGDSAVVRIVLRGGDVSVPAIDLIRVRLGDRSATFEAAVPGAAGPEGGVPVDFEGRVLGWLFSRQLPGAALEPHAQWLAGWLRLGEQQAQLREAAFTDPLTGAWNRRYFDKFLSAAIERARNARQSITVLIFDIDDFKQYNDRYGHAAADEILTETVRLLRSVIRPSDRVCRIGGDEFAVIFHEPGGPRVPGSHPPESVFEIATRFQEQIRNQRFPKLGLDAPGRLTISGGLAAFPWDGMTPDDLVRCADGRALESKRRGKNAIAFGPSGGEMST
jgi:diguanylate cyclase (GGDEF)-like protein